MCLSFATGNIDEIAVAEPQRGRQNRLGHCYVVVPGQPPHDFDRRIVDWTEAPAEFRQRFTLDSLDQMSKDVIENVDLLIAEPIGIRDKQVGNAPQRFDALVLGAALDRVFQVGDKRLARIHSVHLRTTTGSSASLAAR